MLFFFICTTRMKTGCIKLSFIPNGWLVLLSRVLQYWGLRFGWKQIILLSCPSFLPRLLSLHRMQTSGFSFPFLQYSPVIPVQSHLTPLNIWQLMTEPFFSRYSDNKFNFFSDSDLVKWPCSSLHLLKGLRFHLLFSKVDLVWCYCFIHKIAFTNVKGLTEALTWAFFLIQCSLCLSKFMRYK